MRTFLLCLLVTAAPVAAQTQEQFDIRGFMSPEQVEATGVGALTPEQLIELNAWFNQFAEQVWNAATEDALRQAPPPPPPPPPPPVAEQSATPSVIESRIDGTFEGWDGETIFKLQNGQIWQQSSYAYTYHYAYSPEVLIYQGNGGYTMRVEGVNGTIQVVRLR